MSDCARARAPARACRVVFRVFLSFDLASSRHAKHSRALHASAWPAGRLAAGNFVLPADADAADDHLLANCSMDGE